VTKLLPVTQADRDAVQSFHRIMAARLMADLKSPDRPKLGEDQGDAGTLVQAFARHRLATAEAASGAGEREDFAGMTAGEAIAVTAGNDTLMRDLSFAYVSATKRMPAVAAVIDRARIALAASLPPATDPAIPAGWKLVPVQMTQEMEDAWRNSPGLSCKVAWSAALAAAPTIPATGEAEA